MSMIILEYMHLIVIFPIVVVDRNPTGAQTMLSIVRHRETAPSHNRIPAGGKATNNGECFLQSVSYIKCTLLCLPPCSLNMWGQLWHSGLQVNSSNNRSCTRSMIHIKMHLFSPGCSLPSIAFQCRVVALNSIYFLNLPGTKYEN